MKRLAIIPARAGSKRIPHKNIRDFCGKPMISHVVEAVAKAGVFDTIHVSSDSEEIAQKAAESGYAPAFMRPAELADDYTSMLAVVRYVVEEFVRRGESFDTVALIYATSPLVDPADLSGACAQFESGDRQKALLAVAPFPAPIEHAFRMKKGQDGILPDNEAALAMRTQDLSPAYYDAGMFAFYTPDYIARSAGAGDFTAFRGYVVPSYRVTDIDWPEDWAHAEQLYKAIHHAG